MNKKVEWWIWIGLALIAGCSYVEFICGFRHGPLDWGIVAGLVLVVYGGKLLGRAVLSRRLVGIAFFIAGLVVLIDVTRISWVGVEPFGVGSLSNRWLLGMVLAPVLLSLGLGLQGYRPWESIDWIVFLAGMVTGMFCLWMVAAFMGDSMLGRYIFTLGGWASYASGLMVGFVMASRRRME